MDLMPKLGFLQPFAQDTKENTMTKDEIKELSDLRDQVLSLVKKYNRLSKAGNFTSRLGLADAEAYGAEDSPDVEKYIEKNWDSVGIDIAAPDADMWFPSSI